MLSISRNVRLSVCLFVCLCVCSLLRYRLTVFFPPLPEIGCPIFLEIRNPWGKIMERSGLRYEHFCLKIVENRRAKKSFFFIADFALVHPPMVLVLLSASVERCFVSRMRDFFWWFFHVCFQGYSLLNTIQDYLHFHVIVKLIKVDERSHSEITEMFFRHDGKCVACSFLWNIPRT